VLVNTHAIQTRKWVSARGSVGRTIAPSSMCHRPTGGLPSSLDLTWRAADALRMLLLLRYLSIYQAVEACWVVRHRGSHISIDSRLTDGSKVVSPTHRPRLDLPPSPSQKIPGTHFCQRLSRSQGHGAGGRIR
jgi:hypothetical protein